MQNSFKIKFFDQEFENEKNQRVVDLLITSDSKVEKAYLIDHFFYGTLENLQLLSQELEKENFNIDHIDDSSLIISKNCIIDEKELTDLTLFLQNTAQKYDADYDGWGTQILE